MVDIVSGVDEGTLRASSVDVGVASDEHVRLGHNDEVLAWDIVLDTPSLVPELFTSSSSTLARYS